MAIPAHEIDEARKLSRKRWDNMTPEQRAEEFRKINRPVPADHPWLDPDWLDPETTSPRHKKKKV